MEYEPERVRALVQAVPWRPNTFLRLFWIRLTSGSRDEFAARLADLMSGEDVVPVVLRSSGFKNANSMPSDVLDLFEKNRSAFEALSETTPGRLTVLIVARDEYQLAHDSSPLALPDWFPVGAATETDFTIADLGQVSEFKPANCEEVRIAAICELCYELEVALVHKLQELEAGDRARLEAFLSALMPSASTTETATQSLESFLRNIADYAERPRAYRLDANQNSKHLSARMLKLVLASSPKQLALVAASFAACFPRLSSAILKQPYSAVVWRPANAMSTATSNWHAILVGLFNAYQLMNACAHAGDFPDYPVALQYAHSKDLRRFLVDARQFVKTLS
jgi:hypothetical protein